MSFEYLARQYTKREQIIKRFETCPKCNGEFTFTLISTKLVDQTTPINITSERLDVDKICLCGYTETTAPLDEQLALLNQPIGIMALPNYTLFQRFKRWLKKGRI